MSNHLKKVNRKLVKFYERIKKAKLCKVTNEILQNPKLSLIIVENQLKGISMKMAKNIIITIGETGSDFVNNTKTIRIEYTYPKYGNM